MLVLILWVIIAIALFTLYHKIFTVVYFNSLYGFIFELMAIGLISFWITSFIVG